MTGQSAIQSDEAIVTVNGTQLNTAQAITVRLAVDVYDAQLKSERLGDGDQGQSMVDIYRARLGEVKTMLHDKPNPVDSHPILFSENGLTLRLGDKLAFVDPKNDEMFYNSNLGKTFKKYKVDKACLEVKQHAWLEVYFELTFEFEGASCTEGDLSEEWLAGKDEYSADDPNDQDSIEFYSRPFTERGDYTFARYFISKGGQLLAPV
jgi:hypothetical protein